MDILIKAAQLILSLSILVVLHEFGHYIPAKLFKTRVEKFYLFFDPWFSLFKRKIGDTEWGIGWLPLGGYVKIAGMVDESMDKNQLAQEPKPDEFRSKKAWQRLIIMIGGVTVNVIVGVLIYILIAWSYGEEQIKTTELKAGLEFHPYLQKYGMQSGDNILKIDGKPVNHINEINAGILLRDVRKLSVLKANGEVKQITLPEQVDYEFFQEGAFPAVALRTSIPQIAKIEPGKNAEKAGLKAKDKIVSINGDTLVYYDDLRKNLYENKGKEVNASVLRDGKIIDLTVQVDPVGKIGFVADVSTYNDEKSIKTKYYSFSESISKGIQKGATTLGDYTAQMKFIFTKKGASSIGGFASIGNMFPPTWNWEVFWMNTAFISIVLAFMNILPIPALDGGHVVFLLYEIVTGKEAPQKVLEYAQYAGFILLLGLLLYANGNDIYRFVFGG